MCKSALLLLPCLAHVAHGLFNQEDLTYDLRPPDIDHDYRFGWTMADQPQLHYVPVYMPPSYMSPEPSLQPPPPEQPSRKTFFEGIPFIPGPEQFMAASGGAMLQSVMSASMPKAPSLMTALYQLLGKNYRPYNRIMKSRRDEETNHHLFERNAVDLSGENENFWERHEASKFQDPYAQSEVPQTFSSQIERPTHPGETHLQKFAQLFKGRTPSSQPQQALERRMRLIPDDEDFQDFEIPENSTEPEDLLSPHTFVNSDFVGIPRLENRDLDVSESKLIIINEEPATAHPSYSAGASVKAASNFTKVNPLEPIIVNEFHSSSVKPSEADEPFLPMHSEQALDYYSNAAPIDILKDPSATQYTADHHGNKHLELFGNTVFTESEFEKLKEHMDKGYPPETFQQGFTSDLLKDFQEHPEKFPFTSTFLRNHQQIHDHQKSPESHHFAHDNFKVSNHFPFSPETAQNFHHDLQKAPESHHFGHETLNENFKVSNHFSFSPETSQNGYHEPQKLNFHNEGSNYPLESVKTQPYDPKDHYIAPELKGTSFHSFPEKPHFTSGTVKNLPVAPTLHNFHHPENLKFGRFKDSMDEPSEGHNLNPAHLMFPHKFNSTRFQTPILVPIFFNPTKKTPFSQRKPRDSMELLTDEVIKKKKKSIPVEEEEESSEEKPKKRPKYPKYESSEEEKVTFKKPRRPAFDSSDEFVLKKPRKPHFESSEEDEFISSEEDYFDHKPKKRPRYRNQRPRRYPLDFKQYRPFHSEVTRLRATIHPTSEKEERRAKNDKRRRDFRQKNKFPYEFKTSKRPRDQEAAEVTVRNSTSKFSATFADEKPLFLSAVTTKRPQKYTEVVYKKPKQLKDEPQPYSFVDPKVQDPLRTVMLPFREAPQKAAASGQSVSVSTKSPLHVNPSPANPRPTFPSSTASSLKNVAAYPFNGNFDGLRPISTKLSPTALAFVSSTSNSVNPSPTSFVLKKGPTKYYIKKRPTKIVIKGLLGPSKPSRPVPDFKPLPSGNGTTPQVNFFENYQGPRPEEEKEEQFYPIVKKPPVKKPPPHKKPGPFPQNGPPPPTGPQASSSDVYLNLPSNLKEPFIAMEEDEAVLDGDRVNRIKFLKEMEKFHLEHIGVPQRTKGMPGSFKADFSQMDRPFKLMTIRVG